MDLQERMARERQSSGPAPEQQSPLGGTTRPPYAPDPRQAPMWAPPSAPSYPSQPAPQIVHAPPWTAPAPAPPVGVPPVVTSPPLALQRPVRHHALLVTLLLGLLLVIVAAVPLLQGLFPTTTTHVTAPPAGSATAGPQGTPNPAAFTWLGKLRTYAERKYVDSLISKMTLDEEIGQMLQVSFYGDGKPMLQPAPWMLEEISRYHIGSVILYNANLSTAESAHDWVQQLQAQAKVPLLIGTDMEGGSVSRLQAIWTQLRATYDLNQLRTMYSIPSCLTPNNYDFGRLPAAWQMVKFCNDPKSVRQIGRWYGKLLSDLGMNNDYAPVVDVQSVPLPAGGELDGRIFSSSPQQVTRLAGAFLAGLQETHQVVGTLKHFPGLGAVPVDPHAQLYVLERGLSDLTKTDWAPYAALIAAGQVNMIMSTHVVVAAVDRTRPATLSKKVITGILRQQLHYDGVIITDAVYMLGREGAASFEDAVREAVEAGNDIISAITSLEQAEAALQVLKAAVKSGAISKHQIDDSVRRILLVKLHYGILSQPQTSPQP